MQAYLEARQRIDLRRDVVARRLQSEGPFSVGDRVFYLQLDKSSTNRPAQYQARVPLLVRGTEHKVVSQHGALCVIDAGVAIVWVN